MGEGNDSERREYPRISAELHVEFSHLGGAEASHAEVAENISSGGVFLRTSVVLPVGTVMSLTISPGPSQPPIRLEAEVVRTVTTSGTTGSVAEASPYGMGLKFLDAPGDAIDRLLAVARSMHEVTA